MNRQLEALLLAYDAATQMAGKETLTHRDRFENLLAEVLEQHPGLDRQSLMRAILIAHARWVRAQNKNAAIPPQA